jgi:uncharacterized RDD family membrane protein YckC
MGPQDPYGHPDPHAGPGGYGPHAVAPGAGLGRRIAARILDLVIVALPASLVIGIFGGALLGTGTAGPEPVSSIVIPLLWFGYFVFLESRRGATVGKQLAGIRVVGTDGGLPSTEVAAKRNLWMLLGLVPWAGPYLSLIATVAIVITIKTGSDAHGWHDEWAGSAVVLA